MIRKVETPAPTRRTALLLFGAGAVVVAVDQVTKALVVSDLREGESRRVIGGVLAWTLQRNPGSAFGLFRHFPVVFTVLAALIALVIVVRAPRVHDRLTGVALGLVLDTLGDVLLHTRLDALGDENGPEFLEERLVAAPAYIFQNWRNHLLSFRQAQRLPMDQIVRL